MGVVWVFIGGGIGSCLRYFIGVLFSKSSLSLPIATLSANLISCLIFAVSLWAINTKTDSNTNLKLFLITGVCGGLSTFSTFSYETFELFRQQNYIWGSVNIFLSVLLCILIFYTFIGKIH